MTKKSVSKDDIAAELHNWAINEMHFRPIGRHVNQSYLPTAADFAEICKGQTGNIWKFVIDNIYSAQTVRKVQGNLVLKRHQNVPVGQSYRVMYGSGEHYDQGRADLMDRHRALIGDIMSARVNIGQLENDVQHTKNELVKVEQQYQNLTSHVRDVQRKTAILKVHSGHISEEVKKLAEYTTRVASRVQKLNDPAKKTSSEETLYSHKGHSDRHQPGLESPCTKNVRECCHSVEKFLHGLLKGNFGTDKDVMAKNKASVWRKVEDLLDSYTVSQLVMSLFIYTQESTFAVQEKTQRINIKKDAAELRFKYEGEGQMSDLSKTPSLLQSVQGHLEDIQKEQIKRFMETERCRNSAWRLESRMERAQELLDDCLRQAYRDSDPGVLQLAKSLVDLELQVVTSRCAVRVFEAVSVSLKEKINHALQEKEELYTKYQKIQGFKKTVDMKQNLIRVLVRQNLGARSRLETQQRENNEYMGRSFGGQDEETKLLTSQLQDSVIKEVEAFATLPLSNLLFTLTDSAYKMAVLDLSINRLWSNQNSATGHVIQKLLQNLEYQTFMSPEGVLSHIMELQREAATLEMSLHQEHDDEEGGGWKSQVDRMTALCKEVASHDERQIEQILPVLQKRLVMLSQALTDCLHTKDVIQAWWEQPAPLKVPWVTVDDKTLQQWRDKWTVTVTRLRQL